MNGTHAECSLHPDSLLAAFFVVVSQEQAILGGGGGGIFSHKVPDISPQGGSLTFFHKVEYMYNHIGCSTLASGCPREAHLQILRPLASKTSTACGSIFMPSW